MKIFIFIFFNMLIINLLFSQDNTGDAAVVKKITNGWDYYNAGKYKESLQSLDIEKKQFPERINIYVIMGWDYRELKDFVDMERISNEGIKLQPTNYYLIKNLADALYYQNKYYDCIGMYEKYLKYKNNWNDVNVPYAYYYLGVSYYYLKYFKKADIALSAANHFMPKNYNTLILLAEVKEIQGENKNAFNLFTSANLIQPNTQRAIDGIARTKDK
jgi:tetratricopeptide (TPR) repeat protein